MKKGSTFFASLIIFAISLSLSFPSGDNVLRTNAREVSPVMEDNTNARWVHNLAEKLEIDRNGPFIALPDGKLLTVDAEGLKISEDDGKTWSEPTFICKGLNPREPASYYLLRTRNNILVLVYLNFSDWRFDWDAETKEPREGCKLEVWSIRSLDGGKTWVDNQRVVEGYNTNFFAFIETSKGRLLFAVDHLVSSPGRFVVFSLYSDDEGKTWKRSNIIDLGGHGHHDGALEPTLAELSDGRILMLIRTNLDRFWQAISEDGGRYWRLIMPSQIDASSAPGYLLRLQSGRLVLVWNRVKPEEGEYQRPCMPQHCEVLASWFREELSIAFSEDDGRTWTRPVVLARQKGGQLSYPFVFERRPGEIWISAGFAFKKGWEDPLPLRIKIKEEEFVRFAKEKGH